MKQPFPLPMTGLGSRLSQALGMGVATMSFLTFEEALHALDRANDFCCHVDQGLSLTLNPADLELAALGLFVIVVLAGYTPTTPCAAHQE